MTDRGEFAEDADALHEAPVKEVTRAGAAVVVHLAGELDLYNAATVRETLLESASARPERLVVDLSAVRFIDSTALGVLIEARTKLPDARAFLLAAPRLETTRALSVAGLDRHFAVHETVADALAAELE